MSQKPDQRPLELFEIDADRAGQRLDNFLFQRLKDVPKSAVYRLLRTGQVRINKGRVRPHYKLQAGDQLRIPPIRLDAPPVAGEQATSAMQGVAERLHKAVLYEDDSVLVLDKPAGLAVHGGSGLKFGLIESLKSSAGVYAGLELVHRLDRGTSGCLLLAKNHRVLRTLHELLRQHQVEKVYYALLAGSLEHDVSIDAALSRTSRGGERMVDVADEGKAAQSHIVPLRHFARATLVEVRIDTGRTHQIRVHCASLGHPVAGDEKYGDRGFNKLMRQYGLRRLFLHARSVQFTLDKTCHVTAPLPPELQRLLDKLDETEQGLPAADF